MVGSRRNMGVTGYGVLAEVPYAGDAQSTSVCQYLCDQVPMHCYAGGNVIWYGSMGGHKSVQNFPYTSIHQGLDELPSPTVL